MKLFIHFLFNLISIFLFINRLRQEFGIVKKLNNQSTSNSIQNEQNINISQKPVSSSNEFKSNTENNPNQFDCSYTSCDCPRCRNMSGNYIKYQH